MRRYPATPAVSIAEHPAATQASDRPIAATRSRAASRTVVSGTA